jgi:hypothetical protein
VDFALGDRASTARRKCRIEIDDGVELRRRRIEREESRAGVESLRADGEDDPSVARTADRVVRRLAFVEAGIEPFDDARRSDLIEVDERASPPRAGEAQREEDAMEERQRHEARTILAAFAICAFSSGPISTGLTSAAPRFSRRT